MFDNVIQLFPLFITNLLVNYKHPLYYREKVHIVCMSEIHKEESSQTEL